MFQAWNFREAVSSIMVSAERIKTQNKMYDVAFLVAMFSQFRNYRQVLFALMSHWQLGA